MTTTPKKVKVNIPLVILAILMLAIAVATPVVAMLMAIPEMVSAQKREFKRTQKLPQVKIVPPGSADLTFDEAGTYQLMMASTNPGRFIFKGLNTKATLASAKSGQNVPINFEMKHPLGAMEMHSVNIPAPGVYTLTLTPAPGKPTTQIKVAVMPDFMGMSQFQKRGLVTTAISGGAFLIFLLLLILIVLLYLRAKKRAAAAAGSFAPPPLFQPPNQSGKI